MARGGAAKWSFRLFGRLNAQRDDLALSAPVAGKPLELLGYLLLYRDRPHSREALAAMLWGDIPTARSKKYLRQTLWHLQAVLDEHDTPHRDHVLAVDANWAWLSPSIDLWLDVRVFEDALASTRGVAGQDLGPRHARALQAAVRLYRGDLLEGCYQDWCLFERERLKSAYLVILDKLMGYCEAHDEHEAVAAYGAQILRYDRAHEPTYCRLMRLRYRAGDRAGAIREYQRCVAALDQELGVTPSLRTQALYDRIQSDNLDVTPGERGHEVDESRLTVLLHRLRQLRIGLADVEQEVQQEFRAAALARRQR